MARHTLTIRNTADREQAHSLLAAAPYGVRFEIKSARRTADQNSRMWAMLTDVSQQVKWHGLTLPPDDWKLLFIDALKRELRMVPNLDGNGFVNLGRSSSDLTIEEMSDLIELIFQFGANHGVTFHDEISSQVPLAPCLTPETKPAASVPTPAAGAHSKVSA